ncbi:MAG TPA: lamin tail domain-containing protein, partial [Propionibacterium sp.]|nr:lamin tail domain-containing protein [Propionibacterium sp.]
MDGSDLIINEVFARGGSTNQAYQHKYIELYNPTDAAIDLTGYGLSYSSASNEGLGNVCNLTSSLEAGGFYVVTVGSNDTNGEAVVGDQNCTNINPSGTNGAMNLVTGVDTVVDLVGWGTAKRYEGSAAAAYPGGNTTAGSITRTGAVDTDDNAADFTFTETPTPGWDDSIDGSTDPTDPTDPT